MRRLQQQPHGHTARARQRRQGPLRHAVAPTPTHPSGLLAIGQPAAWLFPGHLGIGRSEATLQAACRLAAARRSWASRSPFTRCASASHAPATAIYTRVAIKVIAGTPSPLDRLQLSVTPPAWWSSKTFCTLFGAKADFKRCSLKLTISSGVTRAASSYPRNSVSLRHFSAPSAYRSTALRQLLHSLGPNSLGPRTKPRHVLIQRRCRGPRWAHQAGDP
jgi:hypothetical protein